MRGWIQMRLPPISFRLPLTGAVTVTGGCRYVAPLFTSQRRRRADGRRETLKAPSSKAMPDSE